MVWDVHISSHINFTSGSLKPPRFPGQLRLARDFHRGDLLGAGSYGHLAEVSIFSFSWFQISIVPYTSVGGNPAPVDTSR